MTRAVDRPFEPRHDQPANQRRVAKPYLGLGGMDVYIDQTVRHIEEQRDQRMAVTREHIGIGATDRPDQQPVLDRPAIDEQILVIRDAPVESRQAGDAAQHQPLPRDIHGHAIIGKRMIDQRGNPGGLVVGSRDVQRRPPIMDDRKSNVRPGHRQPADDIQTGGIFGPCASQELAPGGNALEQAIDPDARARRQAGGTLVGQCAIVDNAHPSLGTAWPAFQRQPGDAGDRGQCFTAKAESRDRLDHVIRQLRRGVALKGQGHVGGRHPGAVIGHIDQIDAAICQPDTDPRRAGVDRVLDKFLQRAGRSFDHFARGDPIDQMFRQAAY